MQSHAVHVICICPPRATFESFCLYVILLVVNLMIAAWCNSAHTDPKTSLWLPIAPMPKARHGTMPVVVGSKIWVLAGSYMPSPTYSSLIQGLFPFIYINAIP